MTPSVSLRAGVGRSTRVPTFDELYHPSQRGLVGNPELVPEAAWEAEVGVEHRRRRFSVGASLFARRIENTILYVNRNAFVIRPENLGVSHAAGAELDADGRLDLGPVRCRGEVSATLLASRLSDTSAPLPTRPPLIVDARLSLEPKIASRRPLEVFSRIRHASETKANLQNTIVVDPYLRWDAGVVVRPSSGVVASLLVTNLLDDRGLVTVNKVPLPGRTVLASVTIKEVSL